MCALTSVCVRGVGVRVGLRVRVGVDLPARGMTVQVQPRWVLDSR